MVEQMLYTPRYPSLQNITLEQVMTDSQTAILNLEGNPAPVVQEEGGAPGPVWTGAENLVPTLGFNPQIIEPHYKLRTKCGAVVDFIDPLV